MMLCAQHLYGVWGRDNKPRCRLQYVTVVLNLGEREIFTAAFAGTLV